MSTAEFARKVHSMVSSQIQSRPMVVDFEMAYQARVASDRIRFAIRQLEALPAHTEDLREVGMHLLDALDRLQAADRTFQSLCRSCASTRCSDTVLGHPHGESNGAGGEA